MEWRNEPCRVVVFDLQGDEADFRRFMSNLRIGIDEESLHAPVRRYLGSLLAGWDIEITPRPDFYRPGTLYEVRPVEANQRVTGAGTEAGRLPPFRERHPKG
jgi:hypothetical protein